MPSKGTTLRNVRVPDKVWDSARARAREEGTTVSALVQSFLREYGTPPPGSCGAVWYRDDLNDGIDCVLDEGHKGRHKLRFTPPPRGKSL